MITMVKGSDNLYRSARLSLNVSREFKQGLEDCIASEGGNITDLIELVVGKHLVKKGYLAGLPIKVERRGRKPAHIRDGKKAYLLLAEKLKRSLTEEEALFVIESLPEHGLTLEDLIDRGTK